MKLTLGILGVLFLGVGVLFWMNHTSDANHFPSESSEGKDKPSQFGSDRVKVGKT